MSMLKLDDRREKQDERTKYEHEAIDRKNAPDRSETIGLMVMIGLASLATGWWVAVQNHEFLPLAGAMGIVIGVFLFAGIVGLIAYKFTGKWKLAFTIAAVLIIASQIVSTVRDQQLKSAAPTPTPRPRY